MTKILRTNDRDSVFYGMKRQIKLLERQNLLLNAAIDAGPGLAVKVPEGIHVKPGGSVAIEGDEGLDMKAGSSIKGDTNIKGGVDATGGIKSGGQVEGQSLKSFGDVNADGVSRSYAGAMFPIDGSMKQAGPQIEAAKSAAGAAQSRADSAWNLANSKPTTAYVDAQVSGLASDARVTAVNFKLNQTITALEQLSDQVTSFHPTKPPINPPVKD